MHGVFESPDAQAGYAFAVPFTAAVVDLDGSGPTLQVGTRKVLGRRAVSCLVEPAVGDRILAVEDGDGVFVLAILERPSATSAMLSVPNATTVTLAQDRLGFRAEVLTVDAGTATLRSRQAQVVGRTLKAVADGLDVIVRTLRRTADQEFSHARNATRTVEGAETVKAGELLIEAKTALAQRAGIVLIDATEDVRINGERITMG